MQNSKTRALKGVLIAAVVAILFTVVVALGVLYGKDDYAGVELDGWDVIPRMYPSFWVWVKVLAAVGVFFAWLSYVQYVGTSIGRYIRGEFTWVVFAGISCVCFAAPWSVVGAAKANGGFTLPKPKVAIVEHAKAKGWTDADLVIISWP